MFKAGSTAVVPPFYFYLLPRGVSQPHVLLLSDADEPTDSPWLMLLKLHNTEPLGVFTAALPLLSAEAAAATPATTAADAFAMSVVHGSIISAAQSALQLLTWVAPLLPFG